MDLRFKAWQGPCWVVLVARNEVQRRVERCKLVGAGGVNRQVLAKLNLAAAATHPCSASQLHPTACASRCAAGKRLYARQTIRNGVAVYHLFHADLPRNGKRSTREKRAARWDFESCRSCVSCAAFSRWHRDSGFGKTCGSGPWPAPGAHECPFPLKFELTASIGVLSNFWPPVRPPQPRMAEALRRKAFELFPDMVGYETMRSNVVRVHAIVGGRRICQCSEGYEREWTNEIMSTR
jgi:hypothetical protein